MIIMSQEGVGLSIGYLEKNDYKANVKAILSYQGDNIDGKMYIGNYSACYVTLI